MKLTVTEDNRIFVTARELSKFARGGRRGTNINFQEVGDIETIGDEFLGEYSAIIGTATITSTPDIVYRINNRVYVEKIFEKGRITKNTSPLSDAMAFSESVVTAYLVAVRKNVTSVTLRITFTTANKSTHKSFESAFNIEFLKSMTEALVERATPFIKIESDRIRLGIPSLKSLPFPYKSPREAQKEFITEAYRNIKHGDRLLVTAPTGVGKTISALYPALRAVGSGFIDKVFYLTAKTETGIAARNACRDLSKHAPSLRCVSVIAKERVCPSFIADRTNKGDRCKYCPLTKAIGNISYEQRRDAALIDLLKENIIDATLIQSVANKYSLCPYELSLDVSEYAEVIVCDYNYVFDPKVRFRRYFKDKCDLKFAFLIDEAHNLADRARSMYSATFDADLILRLYKYSAELFPGYPRLIDSITEVASAVGGVVMSCREEEMEIDEENTAGFYISPIIPKDFVESFETFVRVAKQVAKEDETAAAELEECIDAADAFIASASLFNDGFRFFAELVNNHLTISIQCLDPSGILDNMMKSALSSILFSATLTPMDYFADVLGCNDAMTIELDSPYDKDNLCLIAFDGISTRYQDRKETAEDIAEIILSTIEAREGNYIVYFPSYEFMRGVYNVFNEMAPYCNTIVQKSKMSHTDREAFLASFKTGGDVIGFCVLGGAFAEGVDLKGESLIGTIIVGTGLPKISSSQNILKDYFDTTRENGFAYAYKYPAMIKVLQAAGRVIRSEDDCGVVVLVDDRYGEPDTYRLFPKAWGHIKYTADPYSLNTMLERFWEEHETYGED